MHHVILSHLLILHHIIIPYQIIMSYCTTLYHIAPYYIILCTCMIPRAGEDILHHLNICEELYVKIIVQHTNIILVQCTYNEYGERDLGSAADALRGSLLQLFCCSVERFQCDSDLTNK